MTKLEALIQLRDNVKVGEFDHRQWVWQPIVGSDVSIYLLAENAYNGSLDAALALHEAVLPGWFWYRQGFAMFVTDDHTGWGSKPHFSARDDENPARAWLLAILEALISQETGT